MNMVLASDEETLEVDAGSSGPNWKTVGLGVVTVLAGVGSVKAGAGMAIASGGVASPIAATAVLSGVKAIGIGIADIDSGLRGRGSLIPVVVNAMLF